jgi:hypothetical protein
MSPGCCGGGGGESHGKQVMQGQMSEQQEEIAKWVRWNVKTKEAPVKGTVFRGNAKESFKPNFITDFL